MANRQGDVDLRFAQVSAPSQNFGLAWLGLAWLGLVWLGLAWFGLAWLGLGWLGLAWLGLAKYSYQRTRQYGVLIQTALRILTTVSTSNPVPKIIKNN
jgi:hypothetical protein